MMMFIVMFYVPLVFHPHMRLLFVSFIQLKFHPTIFLPYVWTSHLVAGWAPLASSKMKNSCISLRDLSQICLPLSLRKHILPSKSEGMETFNLYPINWYNLSQFLLRACIFPVICILTSVFLGSNQPKVATFFCCVYDCRCLVCLLIV